MATAETNRSVWNDQYDWSNRGDEWSKAWGSARVQWDWTLFPRISSFLPTGTVLEIGPGYGRWTQFIKSYCKHLILVDLAPNCIDACRGRFAADSHISYAVNNGASLDMIPDGTVDFAFSFDSLVHADPDVMASYIVQLSRKLSSSGVAFLHHSNLGEHQEYINSAAIIPDNLKNALIACGVLDSCHFRAHGMTARIVEDVCSQVGLQCIGQEKFPWYGNKRSIDCVSLITRAGSIHARKNQVIDNTNFMVDVNKIAELSRLYGATNC